jgi:hypothetical protein
MASRSRGQHRQPEALTARDASLVTDRYKARGVRSDSSPVDEQEKP